MKKVWISYCTEYEFGQRPDGCIISDNREAIEKEMLETNQGGTREQFWRYDQPQEVWCTKKTFKEIMFRQVNNSSGVAHFGNADRSKLELYKRL